MFGTLLLNNYVLTLLPHNNKSWYLLHYCHFLLKAILILVLGALAHICIKMGCNLVCNLYPKLFYNLEIDMFSLNFCHYIFTYQTRCLLLIQNLLSYNLLCCKFFHIFWWFKNYSWLFLQRF